MPRVWPAHLTAVSPQNRLCYERSIDADRHRVYTVRVTLCPLLFATTNGMTDRKQMYRYLTRFHLSLFLLFLSTCYSGFSFVAFSQSNDSWTTNALQKTEHGTASKSSLGTVGCSFHAHRAAGSKPMVRQLIPGSLPVNTDGTCTAEWLEAEVDIPVLPQYGQGETQEERTITEPRVVGPVSPAYSYGAFDNKLVY